MGRMDELSDDGIGRFRSPTFQAVAPVLQRAPWRTTRRVIRALLSAVWFIFLLPSLEGCLGQIIWAAKGENNVI